MKTNAMQFRPPPATDNPNRLAAFDAYYSAKPRFETFDKAKQAAKKGNWVCRIDNQRGGEFFTLHVRFINPPFNAAGFLNPGTILGQWNEITYVEQRPK